MVILVSDNYQTCPVPLRQFLWLYDFLFDLDHVILCSFNGDKSDTLSYRKIPKVGSSVFDGFVPEVC